MHVGKQCLSCIVEKRATGLQHDDVPRAPLFVHSQRGRECERGRYAEAGCGERRKAMNLCSLLCHRTA
jgi:hypothetical protein